MSKTIIWTPQQRQSVVDFLRQYADKVEADMNNPQEHFGLRWAQQAAWFTADHVFPSGTKYEVNRGPETDPMADTTVLLTDEEHAKFEKERAGE